MKYNNGSTCKVSIDGTDFCIQQLKPFNKMWYSHKFNRPGVQYEVAISIQGGDIVWVNGPFACGSWPDIKIFRQNLKHALLPGEKVEANLGYRGEPAKVDLPEDNIFGSSAQKEAHWCVLDTKLATVASNNGVKKIVLLYIAVLTQISIKYGNKIFMVDYKTKSIKDVMKYKN